MTERNHWVGLRSRLMPYGTVVRVENPAYNGTPDVCYCLLGVTGWLELKHIDAWPARASTPVLVASLTLDQVNWAKMWERAGGKAGMLLSVGTYEFLLDPHQIGWLFERKMTQKDLAACYHPRSTGELVKWLTTTPKTSPDLLRRSALGSSVNRSGKPIPPSNSA